MYRSTWLASLDVCVCTCWRGGLCHDKLVSGDQFAISSHISAALWALFFRADDCHTLRHGGIHSSPPLLSVIMKFYSSLPRRRPRNIKDVASLSTPDEVIHPPLLQSDAFLSKFPLVLRLGGPDVFAVPHRLTFWFPWTNALLSSKTFPPSSFTPLPSPSRVDRYLDAAGGDGPIAGSDRPQRLCLLI